MRLVFPLSFCLNTLITIYKWEAYRWSYLANAWSQRHCSFLKELGFCSCYHFNVVRALIYFFLYWRWHFTTHWFSGLEVSGVHFIQEVIKLHFLFYFRLELVVHWIISLRLLFWADSFSLLRSLLSSSLDKTRFRSFLLLIFDCASWAQFLKQSLTQANPCIWQLIVLIIFILLDLILIFFFLFFLWIWHLVILAAIGSLEPFVLNLEGILHC